MLELGPRSYIVWVCPSLTIRNSMNCDILFHFLGFQFPYLKKGLITAVLFKEKVHIEHLAYVWHLVSMW